jgi:hypothetical protein
MEKGSGYFLVWPDLVNTAAIDEGCQWIVDGKVA